MSKAKKDKGFGDTMPIVIENILIAENIERNRFIKQQNKRLEELRQIAQQKKRAQQKKQVIKKLQNAGILDERGEIASQYRIEDEQ